MANRQYIGARYVPIIYENSDGTSEWRSGVMYEPLTIVTYNGNSYTSKKPVPANVGNPSENTAYWASTGNYNAQVESLRQEVEEYKEKVDDLESGDVKVLYPPLLLMNGIDTNGSCQIMYVGENAVLTDLGRYETFPSIRGAMDNAGIRKIDHVIITHWHGDHSGEQYNVPNADAFNVWKNAFDMTETVFWVPKNVANYAFTGLEKLQASFPNNTINIVESNGNAFDWKNVLFSIYNVSEADYAYYDANTDDYNAYSMIVYADYGKSRICNTGDVNPVAQRRAVEQGYCFASDVMTVPHHAVNTDGFGEFANTIRPRFCYISNFAYSYMNSFRDPVIKMASAFATFFDNISSIRRGGVSFSLTKNGVACAASPIVVSGYAIENIRTVYVDPSVSETSQQLGTASRPFKYIRRAISACKDFTIIELLGNTSETIVITAANGYVTINGNNHSIGYMTVISGGHAELHNITVAGGNIQNSELKLENVRTSGTLSVNNSYVSGNNLAAIGDITLVNGNRSMFAVNNVSSPQRTSANKLFIFTFCFATGNFSLGQIGADPSISCENSYCDFGRLVDAGSTLPKIWDHAHPPLIVYDTTNSRYARILSDGTLKAVTMA